MSEMQDAFEAEKANSDKAFDMYIEAQAIIEAQSKLIEELRGALQSLHDQAEHVYIGSLTPMDIRGAAQHLVHSLNVSERILFKANPHSEKADG